MDKTNEGGENRGKGKTRRKRTRKRKTRKQKKKQRMGKDNNYEGEECFIDRKMVFITMGRGVSSYLEGWYTKQ